MDLTRSYSVFLDRHAHCRAPHAIDGHVPRDGGPASVTLTCRGCGQSHEWRGSPIEARRVLDAAVAVTARRAVMH